MSFSQLNFTRTRLAPSPTGMLHLGHVQTFMIAWWLAHSHGAEVILRWDDLDTQRVKSESVQLLREDLAWLGIKPEQEFFQSQRLPLYHQALEKLRTKELIYPCTCTRQQVFMSAPHEGEGIGRYPGTCRGKYEDLAQAGAGAYWRLKVPAGEVAAEDLLAPAMRQDVQVTCGDIALTHADGKIGYHLSSVIDDADLGVDCVVRGDDLRGSTPQHMILYQVLGLQTPLWCHVPLVMGPTGRRLAKRDGESRVAQLRHHGVKPERIIGWALWRIIGTPKPAMCSLAEAQSAFDMAKVRREPLIMTQEDWQWLQMP